MTLVDKVAATRYSITWHLSTILPYARMKYSHVRSDEYKHTIVPLGFNARLLRFCSLSEIDRWSAVFVGTSGRFHGLKLIVDALPHVIGQIPKIKIHIIGPASYEDTKKAAKDSGLESYFSFDGFIEREDELFDKVSRFALGLAPYANLPDSPANYADPGKPKLYAFCGLPVIITRVPPVAEEIEQCGAGIAIAYDAKELAEAIILILRDDHKLVSYKIRAAAFAARYTAEKIFDKAFEDAFSVFNTG